MKDAVILTHGDWKAKVLPSFGMNTFSLQFQNKDILRSPENLEALKDSPFQHGTPLLFPANRTKDGKFTFESKEYQMVLNEPSRNNHLHGLMFDAPFTVLSTTENTLVAQYKNQGERYPFPFIMTATDTLDDTGYTRTLEILNSGNTAMPYTLAYHTTFIAAERFSCPLKEKYDVDINFIPTGKMLPAEQEFIDGTSSEGKHISAFYTANGTVATNGEFTYEFSENFDNIVLFNAKGVKNFMCIEPQAGAVNGLNSGACHVLLPGEKAVYVHKIKR